MSSVLKSADTEMTAAEWQARCDLAALYRIVDHFGWTDVLATHMSVRVPGEPNAFLINHYQELVHEEVEHRDPREILADLRALEDEIRAGLDELESML